MNGKISLLRQAKNRKDMVSGEQSCKPSMMP
nr:MAG TPA: hypothetical protein [Caudoviricetes sp.]